MIVFLAINAVGMLVLAVVLPFAVALSAWVSVALVIGATVILTVVGVLAQRRPGHLRSIDSVIECIRFELGCQPNWTWNLSHNYLVAPLARKLGCHPNLVRRALLRLWQHGEIAFDERDGIVYRPAEQPTPAAAAADPAPDR